MMRLAIIGGIFLAVFVSVLSVAAGTFLETQERQTTYRYLSEALSVKPERTQTVMWTIPSEPLDRSFSKADAALIGQALDETWRMLAVAQETADASILDGRFSGVALERASLSVADAEAHGGRMIVLSQKARPVFFQKDGSLFQAEVEMTVARYLASAEDLDEFTLTQETGVATFLNESDGWRLFSYERRTAEDMPASAANWSGTIRGFNYYPAQTPWSEFWPSFDEAVVKADFDRIRALGGNSVRIFLTQNDFGSEEPGVPLRKLETLLALAERSGLSVVPTLFDLKQDYSLGTWADDSRFLDNVLPVLDASNTIAFVDIKNEPDLDFAHHGKAKVTAWLKTMAGLIRARAPELALTVGWAEAEQASVVSSDLDVITYHDYAPEAGVAARLAQVKDSAKGKPVVVTEIGESTFELAVNFPGSDTSQSIRLATRLDALEAADGVMLWTLNDFEKVDALAVGMSPWVRRSQAVFGVIRVDGSEKPAADIIRERWTGTADYPEG